MKPDKMYHVTNRSHSIVVYSLPEKHIRREFNFRETKLIPYSELVEVSQRPGGRELIYNHLLIEEVEDIKDVLNINPEPEYYLKESEIDNWLASSTLDEFKDALDFAPDGVKDLIKAHAVSLPLNDMAKIEAIKTQLGFDCMAAIKHEKETIEGNDVAPVAQTKRRVAVRKVETKKEGE